MHALTGAVESISREPSVTRTVVATNSVGTGGILVARVVAVVTLIDI